MTLSFFANWIQWAPLLLNGRREDDFIAATRADGGTDVNFGSLTHGLVDYLAAQSSTIKTATFCQIATNANQYATLGRQTDAVFGQRR